MPEGTRAGDVLADRYRLVDLLSEHGNGRFWRAHDRILERHVALHVIAAHDDRAELLLDAARRSATVLDTRFLRVLDAERSDEYCFVVNEWGSGTSLDIMLATNGPLAPREASWIVAEVADSIATAHARAVPHGRLVPENVLVDNAGGIRIIGFCVDAALHGLPPGEPRTDVRDLAGLLHAALTGKWAGDSNSIVPRVQRDHGRVLRPRQIRAGVPRSLDDLCDELLNPKGSRVRDVRDIASARGICVFLTDFVGDTAGLATRIAARNPDKHETVTLPFVPDILAQPDDVDMPPVEGPEPDPVPEDRTETEVEVDGTGRCDEARASCPPRRACRSSTTRTTTCRGWRRGVTRLRRPRRSRSRRNGRCSPLTTPLAVPGGSPRIRLPRPGAATGGPRATSTGRSSGPAARARAAGAAPSRRTSRVTTRRCPGGGRSGSPR